MCASDDRLNITYGIVTGFLLAKVDMSGASDLFFLCEPTLALSIGCPGSPSELVDQVDLLELAEAGNEST